MLADSHVHLDRYPPDALGAMLARARRAGVRRFLTIGVDRSTSEAATRLAAGRRGIRAAIGLHPTRLGHEQTGATIDWMRDLLARPRVAAIGEVGLDDTSGVPLDHQADYFRVCLDLAEELARPLSLHVVGAHRRAQRMLGGRHVRSVVHYFQGDSALAEAYLEIGCLISVGKPATRPDRVALREAVRSIPLERLLLETDTYPLPNRSTEPRDVVGICRAVAELKGVAADEVARVTTRSYERLFGDNPGAG